jgi:hypothetical protein
MRNTMPHKQDDAAQGVGEQAVIDAIVESGPIGAYAVAGVATAIVVGLWVAFYVFAYLPRGVMQ